jgi:hypothetical protein
MIVKGGGIKESRARMKREKCKIRFGHLIAGVPERAFGLIL